MSKHTPGPWKTKLQKHKSGRLDIGILHQEDTKRWIARITDQPGIELEEDLANAERIVACVNACDGLDPALISEVIEAAGEYIQSGPGVPKAHAKNRKRLSDALQQVRIP